jgi:ABC-type ATPase involved in cell division
MSLLAFRQVSKRFPDGPRELVVLDGVSFEIEAGEKVGLLASRRAGKTTLLKIAAGLLAPDEGEVLWDGLDLAGTGYNERARARRDSGVALACGDWRAERSTSVLQHVATPLYSSGLNMIDADKRALRALEWVEASCLAYRDSDGLGLSERLKVELARAIARQPRLLLMDEPAVLPRPEDARAFYELLHSMPDRVGCALLVASEEVSALRGCRPVMSLANGRLHSPSSRRKVIDFPAQRTDGEQRTKGA